MIPSFGVKKAQPAFQVKAAPPPPPSSTSASVNTADAPAAVAPSLTSSASTSTPLPHAVPPPQDAETGECNSDDDFEKENNLIDPKAKKPPAKSKKLKAKKDPNAPKKPTTSYMFFCKQVCLYNFSCVSLVYFIKERQNVQNELGNIGFTATGAELARR